MVSLVLVGKMDTLQIRYKISFGGGSICVLSVASCKTIFPVLNSRDGGEPGSGRFKRPVSWFGSIALTSFNSGHRKEEHIFGFYLITVGIILIFKISIV